jgi:hypothetical protein
MIALALALLDWPYGYYVLLRVLVCGVCIYLTSRERENGRTIWMWVLGSFAVLYNPIVPIHLSRELWSIINLATIWLLAAHMWSVRRHPT